MKSKTEFRIWIWIIIVWLFAISYCIIYHQNSTIKEQRKELAQKDSTIKYVLERWTGSNNDTTK